MPTLSDFELEEGARRRSVLVAALEMTGVSQAELVRKLNLEGQKTAPTTVNRWVRGKVTMGEAMLRYVLTLLGLPADWQPEDPAPPAEPDA